MGCFLKRYGVRVLCVWCLPSCSSHMSLYVGIFIVELGFRALLAMLLYLGNEGIENHK